MNRIIVNKPVYKKKINKNELANAAFDEGYWLFQQDNDSAHVSDKSLKYPKEHGILHLED